MRKKEYLWPYLKQKSNNLLSILLVVAIFVLVFYLFEVPILPAIYAGSISLFFFLCFLFFGFDKEYQKHRQLERIKDSIDEELLSFPSANNIQENKYQEIIQEAYDLKKDIKNRFNEDYNQLLDYYTTWAHQIKTPIASMKLKLETDDSKQARELYSKLNQIEQYVELALTYLKLDRSDNDFLLKHHELDEIIKENIRRYSNDYILNKIKVDFKETNKKILTDSKCFSLVIEQLLSNALKYTKKGTISIYLDDKDRLCIKDTGIGIDKRDLPRVFERGFTGFNGHQGNKKASGIGLYVCKKICDRLSIGINIESEVGKGTIVSLDFQQTERVFE